MAITLIMVLLNYLNIFALSIFFSIFNGYQNDIQKENVTPCDLFYPMYVILVDNRHRRTWKTKKECYNYALFHPISAILVDNYYKLSWLQPSLIKFCPVVSEAISLVKVTTTDYDVDGRRTAGNEKNSPCPVGKVSWKGF